MIGFDLTPEQKALQERARRFSKEVILPVAAKHDRDGTFPLDVMEKAHGEGFFTPLVPKEYGGAGSGGSRYLHHLGGTGSRLHGDVRLHLRQHSGPLPDHQVWNGRTERKVSQAFLLKVQHCLLLPQ